MINKSELAAAKAAGSTVAASIDTSTDYDYGADLIPVGDNILARITGLAQEFLEAEREVAAAQVVLDQKTAAFREIKTHRFPDLMLEAGQKSVTTSTNLKVDLKEVVRASIPEAKQPEAFAWLEATNNAGVIKYELKAELGKGDAARASIDQLMTFCKTIGVELNVKSAVHPQTLAALIRELMSKGISVPMDALGAIVQKEVSVKPTKGKT